MPSPLKLGVVATLVSTPLFALPQITEFVAINATSRTDGDGNTPDWIEIYNPDPTLLDLAGYHLTDDPEIPGKYTFPAGTTVMGGGYLIVFASGQVDSSYIDAGDFRHTNFSLSGSGEYLALNAPDGSNIQEFFPGYPAQFEDVSYGIGTSASATVLLEQGDPSTWFVPDSDIGNGWQLAGFDDASWTAAATGIGYGYDTEIGAGGNTSSAMWFSNASVYLRVPFEVADAAALSSLTLNMRYEDGFVAYLNGVRVAAANAPEEGALDYDSTATAEHPDAEAVEPEAFVISPASLVTGTNILAIHGLNLSASGSNSSDFLALPELVGIESDATGSFGYFLEPTPGEINGPTPLIGFVKDTKFSHDRGYHSEAFDLEITTATPGASIVYTTDGTEPTESNGTTYAGPISISSTSTIRAFAFKENFHPTNIDTQSYLFVDDIVRQTRPAGYPTSWGGVAADYDMDPEVVDDPDYANEFEAAFAALPTLSLVFDPDALFDPSTGIYQRPGNQGDAWERPLSAEFFVPDHSEPGFQINAGIRIQGGSSRNTDTPKHSLSLRFRAEHGDEKLRYPLYNDSPGGETAVEEFDLLQLRPEYNFGWMHRHYYQADHALYGRDQWASDLFNEMGSNGSHGRWVHLYLNGIYWGLYDLHERPDADHMANYFGGNSDDYDTVNSSVATNGDLVAYNQMMDLAYGSIQTQGTYDAIQEYLDVDTFIDYMILNAYIGNRDWDGHNWRAARKREPGAGYKFFPWDSEFAVSHVGGGVFTPPDFYTTSLNTNVTGNNGNRRPTGLQQRLANNEEYRLRYADHVRAHFFNGGPLTPERSAEIWTRRSDFMMDAIVAESARWGDFRRDVLPGRWNSSDFDLYTRDDYYLPTLNWLFDTYLPQRSALVLNQLKARNLYPNLDAPDFARHGGIVARGFQLQVTAPDTIHYTIDGSDPRLTGGAISPSATSLTSGSNLTLNESILLKARTRSAGGEWSALTEASFTIEATNLRFSEIMYHPEPEPLSEFLEIHNSGGFAISLTGLRFTAGVDFDFDLHSSIDSLAADARLLIVRDLDAFHRVHGNAYDALIAGTFQNATALANGGETLTISDANDEMILTVTYNDAAPWPKSSDGGGRSLVFSGGDETDPLNWRPSIADNGNPGSSDSLPLGGESLIDYALSGTPGFEGNLFTYSLKLGADEVSASVQHSADLNNWLPISTAILSQKLSSDGLSRLITVEIPEEVRGFGRVIFSPRE
ncbi:CotH kinase family protein [Akkermansiaceae bacterium]|nr:CotH kinase family protein [Akkermansiaceae bacterium]